MSKETIESLNINTLIGMTDKRGDAWHRTRDIVEGKGLEPNHYPLAIPVDDVNRRLFHWSAVEGDITATALTEDGVLSGSAPTFKAIMRSDTGDVLGIHSQRYGVHQYSQWLIDNVSTVLDASKSQLVIGSAGLLKGGAQAWVQIELPDTMQAAGVKYRPFMTAATSHDGSLATTYITGVQVVVCDNTLSAALGGADSSFKIRHSSASLARIGEVRDGLGIVFGIGEQFKTRVEMLVADKVSDREWVKFVAALTKPKGEASVRSKGMAERKVEEIVRLWEYDERVAPWKGTAYGVVAAVNTYATHIQTVKGASRAERNMTKTIMGEWDVLDATTLKVLESVR